MTKPADEFRDKTTAPNQLWQTDFTYLKVIGWGWFYLSTILDDYSRYIIAWKLCTNMTADDVTATLKLALEASGCNRANVVHKPRLLSDNGSSYISGDLAEWLEDHGMDHVRGAPYHPQTQGKIERWHQTLKNRILLENYYLPGDLENQISAFVDHYTYNAQAVLDAGGSQLIVGARVTNCASDRNELVADIAAIPAVLGRPATVLADNGYANGDEVAALAESDIEALVATGSSGRRRRYDFRPAKTEVPVKKPKAEWLKVMAAKLDSEEGRALYRLRQQTVEPVFGIIKAALGFTGFSLRGLDKVAGEWDLVALSYNCKRLHKLKLERAS